MMYRGGLLAALLLAAAPPSHAGVDAFSQQCMANLGNMPGLEVAVAKAGLREINPADGPKIFSSYGPISRQRVWMLANHDQPGDAYTGIASGKDTTQPDLCWHVSRPGENAVDAVRLLQQRYMPLSSTTRRGVTELGSGDEHWGASIDGQYVVIGVKWGLGSVPSQGVGMLYVAQNSIGRLRVVPLKAAGRSSP